MVTAFDSGASGPGSSPGRGHCVVLGSWARYSLQNPIVYPGLARILISVL